MLNILMLYNKDHVNIKFIYDHISALQLYSKHNISYMAATAYFKCDFDLSYFDVIIVHFSIRLCFTWHISPQFYRALQDYQGFKVLHIQDEYDLTEIARQSIESINFNLIYTCVPEKYIETVYPKKRFPHSIFKQVLTGYVPVNWKSFKNKIKPIKDRDCDIGYRGRVLPMGYGNLCREKWLIGERMKEICSHTSLNIDIDNDEASRIYGEKWYDFIMNCKATLGTESGCNIFDETGEIRENINKILNTDPTLTYEEIYEKYLKMHEDNVKMNQIAPKMFEFISFKTALILFEGNYSGVIIPHTHYIPLKKDFSNVAEVIEKIKDVGYLQAMVDRTYIDIIESEKFTYEKFIEDFDILIESEVKQNHFFYKPKFNCDTLEENINKQGKVTFLAEVEVG